MKLYFGTFFWKNIIQRYDIVLCVHRIRTILSMQPFRADFDVHAAFGCKV